MPLPTTPNALETNYIHIAPGLPGANRDDAILYNIIGSRELEVFLSGNNQEFCYIFTTTLRPLTM
jgi:hypothetical protein